MPDVDGVSLVKKLRESWRNGKPLPCILLTTHGHEPEAGEIEGLVDGEVNKPTCASRLFAELARRLGLSSQEDGVAEKRSVAAMERLRSMEILVVDDVVLNQEVVRDILEGAGVRVRIARNGKEAVDAVVVCKPDCVLMDCQMPVMDGYEATRILREKENCRDLPIIAFTANVLDSERDRCREAGMDGIVIKPVRRYDLFSALIRHLFPSTGLALSGTDLSEAYPTPAENERLPEMPGIDQQVGLRYIGGNVQHYRHLLRTFAETNGRDFAADLGAAVQNGDWEDASRFSHSLKSSARLIGAAKLGELSSAMETACRNPQAEKTPVSAMPPLLEELGRVVEGISRLSVH